MIGLQRDKIRMLQKDDSAADETALASSEECLSFVWELTREIYSLSGEHDVESRLQRDVVNIIRK